MIKNKTPLLNTYVNNIRMIDALKMIDNMVINKKKAYIVAINVDVIVKIEKDPALKKIVDNADISLVDGQPLIWISKLYKRPVLEKVSGSDLIPCVLQMAEERGYSVFLLGGKEGIADMAKANIEIDNPNINIVGTYSPPTGFEKSVHELSKINQIISEAKPDILVVCFGCPKQEKWIYQNNTKYEALVSICAGATIDFLAGNISRAPKWMSDHGLEWFYRFMKEPQRMFRRYFVDDLKILALIWKYRKSND